MNILDQLKNARKTPVSVTNVESSPASHPSETPMLDSLAVLISTRILATDFPSSDIFLKGPLGRAFYSKLRQCFEEHKNLVEGDEIDAREKEAIEEGRKYLASLRKDVRANIEAQMGRKLG